MGPMPAIMRKKLTIPVSRVRLFAQAMKRGLSAFGRPSSSQMTDRGSFPRITLDQVSWTSVSEQLSRELIGNCENPWFHVENGAATKGFVDDTAQTCMVWLVHGQHANRECAYPAWHPPAQTGNFAVLAHCKGLTVLQNVARQVAGCGDPGPPYDREAHLHHGARCSQLGEPCGWIAQIVLACEIDMQHGV